MQKPIKKKKSNKSLPKLKSELQIVFNQYIRLRDKGKPCISCGEQKELQAGHYYSVKGYDGLRFDEFNVHGECAGCNCFDESHLINYGENLVNRIGLEEYERLKSRAKEYKRCGYKFDKSYLQILIAEYKQKIKELESGF